MYVSQVARESVLVSLSGAAEMESTRIKERNAMEQEDGIYACAFTSIYILAHVLIKPHTGDMYMGESGTQNAIEERREREARKQKSRWFKDPVFRV